MHIIIVQMLICTQVYADADAHTDHAQGPQTQSLQTSCTNMEHMYKCSLSDGHSSQLLGQLGEGVVLVNDNAFTNIRSTRSTLFLSQQPTHDGYNDVVQCGVE